MLLGNLGKDFNKVFAGGVTVMLPILGWNLGQGMNLIESLQSGFSGILLAVVFYMCMSPLLAVDKVLLKNDGVPAMAIMLIVGGFLF